MAWRADVLDFAQEIQRGTHQRFRANKAANANVCKHNSKQEKKMNEHKCFIII